MGCGIGSKKEGLVDFAECMRELVDRDCPDSDIFRVVLDNFTTHHEASLNGNSTSILT
jgi:hypothetical protein